MGRTQPSLTKSVDRELEKLERVARKLRDERITNRIIRVRENVRYIEEAMQDEVSDPLEVIMLAFLVSE
ncbi:hypothetical protein [Sulfuracidifex tepidarius]|uniref:Uncharacterized protein n=1 Tax=Sulfuracidifex tepidarius TaxID=1294262 RepID=A0A510E3G2_9CREN|nr:hypothetical protein [Sulfuracidifex tepidarius]BBG24288.1 hypothetical protein IC006_1597 [Sulfuracidifex tepidarius]BBG27045.1 hypothetical protein IC007_1574 [Sulfuracidifex tepidarius]